MFRFSAATLIALMTSTSAFAADINVNAPVVAATVFPQGGIYLRRAEVEVSAGKHRFFVPFGGDGLIGAPDIRISDNAQLASVSIQNAGLLDPDSFLSPTQQVAKGAVKALQDRLQANQDQAASIHDQIKAAQSRAEFLAQIAPPTEVLASADDLVALAELIQNGTAEMASEIAKLRSREREVLKVQEEIQVALDVALADLARTVPPLAGSDLLVLDVLAGVAGPVELEIEQATGSMHWSFQYDVALRRGEAPTVVIDRAIELTQMTPFAWEDVSVSLATSNLFAQLEPSPVFPNKASIFEPQQPKLTRSQADSLSMNSEPMMEMSPMVEESSAMGIMETEGLAVRYDFPLPVSLAPTDTSRLSLDSLSFEATEFIQAAPRRDKTAFLMAEFTNTSGAPILGAPANFTRDNQLVGIGYNNPIAPGQSVEMAFGAYDGIVLDVNFARNDTGDRGLIRNREVRRQQITFSVENLTGEAQEIRTLYALPFSEQEDLVVETNALPRPNETDYDGDRGIALWNLSLSPGQKAQIDLDISLSWPEGYLLNWPQ